MLVKTVSFARKIPHQLSFFSQNSTVTPLVRSNSKLLVLWLPVSYILALEDPACDGPAENSFL